MTLIGSIDSFSKNLKPTKNASVPLSYRVILFYCFLDTFFQKTNNLTCPHENVIVEDFIDKRLPHLLLTYG